MIFQWNSWSSPELIRQTLVVVYVYSPAAIRSMELCACTGPGHNAKAEILLTMRNWLPGILLHTFRSSEFWVSAGLRYNAKAEILWTTRYWLPRILLHILKLTFCQLNSELIQDQITMQRLRFLDRCENNHLRFSCTLPTLHFINVRVRVLNLKDRIYQFFR